MSTNFTGATFAEQKITPTDDAIVRRAILPDGILTGCGLSYAGSTLTMAAGQLMVCGRQIRHPSTQNWAVVDAISGYARLLLTIDMTRTATKDTFDQVLDTIEYASSEDGFPDLEQSDINGSGTRYQVVVCVVSLGTGGITGIVSQLGKSVVDSSGGLNFKLVGGETQPSDPTKNMIWVNTPETITSYAFAPSEPSVPSEGMVWIATGTSSAVAFNILKKDTVIVCPLSAKQYIDGVWVDVTAKSYRDGEWVDWVADIVIYDSGATDIALDLTNAGDAGSYLTLTLGLNGTATVKSDLVDLSRQTRLEVVYSNLSGSGTFAGGVRAQVWDENGEVVAQSSRSTAESGTLSVDISALSGKYAVGVYGNNTSGSYPGSCRVTSIKTLMT